MPLVDMTASGGGSPSVTVLETWDATSDLTSLTITSAGTSTLYAADGSTPRASLVVTVVGNVAAGWALDCDSSASPPILLSGVEWTGAGMGGYVSVQVEPVFSASPDWVRDRWFAEALFSAVALDGDSGTNPELIRVGMAPAGTIVQESGAVDISCWDNGGTHTWHRETWDDSDADTASYTAAPSSSIALLCDSLHSRLAIDNGGTSFASDLTSAGPWDVDTVGQGQIASGDDTSAGSYSTGLGIMLHGWSKHTGDGIKIGLSKIKLSVGAPKE